MAFLPEESTFPSGIYQLETTDPCLGGPEGCDNAGIRALGNRTRYLKDHLDTLETVVTQAEAEAGTATTVRGWTAQRVRQAINVAVAAVVNSAPTVLDTLSELASALGNDANFATTITNLIGTKSSKTDVQGCVYNFSVAGGTADALTATFTPAIAAIADQTVFVRALSANETTSPTLAVNALSAITLVKGNNLPLDLGDIAGPGHWLEIKLDYVLGKAVLINPAHGIAQIGLRGLAKDLTGFATGLDAHCYFTASSIILESANGGYIKRENVSYDINTAAAAGINSVDSGTVAAASWYSIWAIYNPITNTDGAVAALVPSLTGSATAGSGVITGLSSTASMKIGMPIRASYFRAGTVIKSIDSGSQITLSTPSSSPGSLSIEFVYEPVMPAGYVYGAHISYIHTDGLAGKYPFSFKQRGNSFIYVNVAGSNMPQLQSMAAGVVGTWASSAPTYAGVATNYYVPPTATKILLCVSNSYNGGSTSAFAIASNANQGGVVDLNPPRIASNIANSALLRGDLEIEESNIHAAANASGFAMLVYGWEDSR